MSNLRIETYTMPAASLGCENPLPMLSPRLSATAGDEVDDTIPFEDRKYFGYGLNAGWLPHRGQDDYDRKRAPRDFQAMILENEFLRATILPEVGGRLWSLVHKPTGRELLYVNPVFQPANLAVRGAWIAGGVEWNPCVYGHSPYTCSSVFAAGVEQTEVGDLLRIYEWDRTRGVPFQLDFSLPDGSSFLYVYVRLVNPHSHTIPMYWWSNITVPESPDVRVVAPAICAYTYPYGGSVRSVTVPQDCDLDFSYSTNIPHGADYFFRISDGGRPWIAALDRGGSGLVQTSTPRLLGRKLFAWGNSAGGRRWQEFLSMPGRPYFEIQAGLARTQMECLPMPGAAQWDWVEAYGRLNCDPANVHGSNWDAAVNEVADQLEHRLPQALVEDHLRRSRLLADRPPQQILHRGSGWGALERIRRERCGELPFCTSGLNFDDKSLGEDQAPWLSLLKDGIFPNRDPQRDPGTFMVQHEWRQMLEESLRESQSDNSLAQLHLGLMYYSDGDTLLAEVAWRKSIQRSPSGWAYRNLAILYKMSGRTDEALLLYAKAFQLLPELRPLVIEYCELLLASNRFLEVLKIIDSLSEALRGHSRIQLLEARAGLAVNFPERFQPILRNEFELVDLREGETSLTELWLAIQSRIRPEEINRTSRMDSHDACESHCKQLPDRLNFQVTPDASSDG